MLKEHRFRCGDTSPFDPTTSQAGSLLLYLRIRVGRLERCPPTPGAASFGKCGGSMTATHPMASWRYDDCILVVERVNGEADLLEKVAS